MFDFDHSEELKSREVRLFPAVRISTEREAEVRATAALLAMVKGVSAFGRAIVKSAGGPAGKISCYTEVVFPPFEPEGPRLQPDGVIRSVRAKQEWKALVEVKVGDSPLEQPQFDNYQRLARDHGYDALITISGQAARADGLPPLNVDGRRLRAMPVVHLSWDRLLSEARMLAQQNAVDDPDQAWMLAEWIRYVADPCSRIMEPPQLGQHWVDILKAAREASLPSVAKYVDNLVVCWEDFLKKECLRLRAKLGVDVQPKIPLRERQDPNVRAKRLYTEVLERGRLSGEIRIPDASDVAVEVGLHAQVVRFCVEIQAPTEGRQQTRVAWLLRQLRDEETPNDLVVKIEWDRKGLSSQAKAADARTEPACLLRDGHLQAIPSDAMPRRFLLEWTRPLQKGKGRSTAPVLEGISTDLEAFYGRVVEGLVPFVAPAPKLPRDSVPEAAKGPAIEVPVATEAAQSATPKHAVDEIVPAPTATEDAEAAKVSADEALAPAQ